MKRLLWSVIVASFSSLPTIAGTAADTVEGAYRLDKEKYCVGEPILIEVTLKNHSRSNFSFSVGGDYRGTLRHDRYSIQVRDASGRDFNQTTCGNMGGLGGSILLLPGEQYRTYLLVNGWTHLLPPGEYQVHCKSQFDSSSFWQPARVTSTGQAVVVEQTLPFRVEEYDRSRILAALKEMTETSDIDREKFKRWEVGKPVGWAYADLSKKFQMVLRFAGNTDDEKTITSRLPAQWDDRLYLEYSFTANRNWLSVLMPEPFILTFSVRNNSNKVLPHGLLHSHLSVDGKDLARWPELIKDMLLTAVVGEEIKPGQVIELKKQCNEFLCNTDTQKLTWECLLFSKTVEVSTRH